MTFNTFNHAQFDGAGSVDGNRDDATFGKILKSQPGRVSQVALKLQFQIRTGCCDVVRTPAAGGSYEC